MMESRSHQIMEGRGKSSVAQLFQKKAIKDRIKGSNIMGKFILCYEAIDYNAFVDNAAGPAKAKKKPRKSSQKHPLND